MVWDDYVMVVREVFLKEVIFKLSFEEGETKDVKGWEESVYYKEYSMYKSVW